MPLYRGKIGGAKPTVNKEERVYVPSVDTVLTNVSQPTLTFFPADTKTNNGTVVLIILAAGTMHY